MLVVLDSVTMIDRGLISTETHEIPDMGDERLAQPDHPPTVSSVQALPASVSEIAPTERIDPLCAMIVADFASIGRSNRVVVLIERAITPERAERLLGWSFWVLIPGVRSVVDESMETLRLVHCFIFWSYSIKYRAFRAVSEVRECDSELKPVEFPVWELICRDFRTT